MQNGSRTIYYTAIALLTGLTLGVIFSEEIRQFFRGDPDNIYTLENGKYSYPITPKSDTLIIPIDLTPDSTGQPLVFTIDPAWSGSIFFTANPGSGFSDMSAPQINHLFAPTIVVTGTPPVEPVVEYTELLQTHEVELTCKVQVAGGGVYRLTPKGTHWEVEQ